MARMIQHTQVSREDVIKSQYVPLFDKEESLISEDAYVEYCKEYVLKEDVGSIEEKTFLHKEKIFRWYIPTLDEDEIEGFLNDFEYTFEELYDDPLMVYRVVDYDKEN